MISLLRKKKPTIGILVTQWFQFSTQFSSPWLCQLQQEQSHCHLFCLFFLNDGDDSRTDLVFVIGIFCFLILNTPKLGWLYNIHSTINNKGCLDLKDIQGNGEVVGYQGEQNWVEIWNLWVTRIPMVCFFFLSSEIVSWNSENGMCFYSEMRWKDDYSLLIFQHKKIKDLATFPLYQTQYFTRHKKCSSTKASINWRRVHIPWKC